MIIHRWNTSEYTKVGAVFFSLEYQTTAKNSGENSTILSWMLRANLLDFIISDGVTHDVKIASDLIQQRVHPNIPSKKTVYPVILYMDYTIYKVGYVVENIFAALKYFRGLVIRYDKLKNSYISNVALAYAYVWLKL